MQTVKQDFFASALTPFWDVNVVWKSGKRVNKHLLKWRKRGLGLQTGFWTPPRFSKHTLSQLEIW